MHVLSLGGLTRVVSGGQTGVDQGALRAALEASLNIGGWCPPGRVCESGVIPEIFPLKETPDDRCEDAPHLARSQRTAWNVRDSDGTLLLALGSGSQGRELQDPGTRWTLECAERLERPHLWVSMENSRCVETIRDWLRTHAIGVLNVAGPSEKTCPGIERITIRCLKEVFTDLR